jgi:hypothetical protein
MPARFVSEFANLLICFSTTRNFLASEPAKQSLPRRAHQVGEQLSPIGRLLSVLMQSGSRKRGGLPNRKYLRRVPELFFIEVERVGGLVRTNLADTRAASAFVAPSFRSQRHKRSSNRVNKHETSIQLDRCRSRCLKLFR